MITCHWVRGHIISKCSATHEYFGKASGIEQKLYPHKLRRTVATHLLESSGNMRLFKNFLVMKILVPLKYIPI